MPRLREFLKSKEQYTEDILTDLQMTEKVCNEVLVNARSMFTVSLLRDITTPVVREVIKNDVGGPTSDKDVQKRINAASTYLARHLLAQILIGVRDEIEEGFLLEPDQIKDILNHGGFGS